jgi:thermostable 8-oxoguanine DNA glycosylase
MGQYTRIARAIHHLVRRVFAGTLDLRTCERDELMFAVPGIGRKTASFFILFSRPGVRDIACLDTHVLMFLRERKLARKIPTSTPQSRKSYLRLEAVFTRLCARLGRPVAEVDFDIWKHKALQEELPDYLKIV